MELNLGPLGFKRKVPDERQDWIWVRDNADSGAFGSTGYTDGRRLWEGTVKVISPGVL